MDTSTKESNDNTKKIVLLPSFNRDILIKQASRKVARKTFMNAVNYVHFVQGYLFAYLQSVSGKEDALVRVIPEPCQGNGIICHIPEDNAVNLTDYLLSGLIVDDGKAISLMPIIIQELTEHYFTGTIRERGYVFTERQGKRFHCQMVSATVKQGDIEAEGVLEDFTLSGLRIILNKDKDVSSASFRENETILLNLYKEAYLIFSGPCTLLRGNTKASSLILRPLNINQKRFRERKNRNPRLNLIPTPKVIFNHPFNNKRVTYEVFDLTTAGFSINEKTSYALMMPGLMIPDITIVYAGGLKLRCSAQVVYGIKLNRHTVRFGFAIYDMDAQSYNKLFDIFSNASDVYANMTSDVDMDALWEFFFESGFIYPKKYETLSKYKDEFKQTYQTLYHNAQDIFASFTYQQNGVIYGHVSILKAYEKTWMIHHLAAKPMGRKRTGLYVLNHVLNYFDGLYRMPSVGMDYMIFYFRPDNKFPDYFFGGFCRELNNPKACSMDCFAYLNCLVNQSDRSLPEGWFLRDCVSEDILDLRRWYEKVSGGLMVDALCLEDGETERPLLESMYAVHGLKREWSSKVLRSDGKVKAFFLMDRSDMGINLSELLNSIKIFVVDDTDLDWDVMMRAICSVASVYQTEMIPVMVYPYSYLDENSVPYDKKYNLWTLSAHFGNEYTEHMKKKAKIHVIKFLFKYMKSKLMKQ